MTTPSLRRQTRLYRVITILSAGVAALACAGLAVGLDGAAWVWQLAATVTLATVPLLVVNQLDVWDARRCTAPLPAARAGAPTNPRPIPASERRGRAARRTRVAMALLFLAPLGLAWLAVAAAIVTYQSATYGTGHAVVDVDLRHLPAWLGGTIALMLLRVRLRGLAPDEAPSFSGPSPG